MPTGENAETQAARPLVSLTDSDERFRLLVESVKDYAIFMLDAQGYVRTWNRGAERIKGYRAEEIIGRHFSAFYSEAEVKSGKCDAELLIAAEEGRFEEEAWRLRKDGSRFWANVVITAVRDDEGNLAGFAKVTRDLTERRQAEEERVRLAQAQEANRVKDEFLATISHELRTPLNAILGWSSVLSERAKDPELSKAAATIRRNALAQARIIEDVLDVSRIINGKMRIEPKPIDLAAIVQDAIEVVRPSADAKEIELFVEFMSKPALLVGDPTRLQQVIWNLLSNAVKFSEAGARITIRVERVATGFEVIVRDTGRGIAPEFLPHVFERFQQADSSTTRKFGGLGLGLSIVRHIVELHGGEVFAESEGLGKGATFRVVLPVRAVAMHSESEMPKHTTPRPSVGRGLRGVTILVVEDERDSRELVESLLVSDGATVHAVESVAEARTCFEKVRPNVIISDIAMPNEDGYALIRSIRALPREQGGATAAVALTAHAASDDRVRVFDAGFNNFLTKPVDAAELLHVLRNLAHLFAFEDKKST